MNDTFDLHFSTTNAAFEGEPLTEVARILRDLADRVERTTGGYPFGTVRDINGNTVGHWSHNASGKG
jgi:hypothetical protein